MSYSVSDSSLRLANAAIDAGRRQGVWPSLLHADRYGSAPKADSNWGFEKQSVNEVRSLVSFDDIEEIIDSLKHKRQYDEDLKQGPTSSSSVNSTPSPFVSTVQPMEAWENHNAPMHTRLSELQAIANAEHAKRLAVERNLRSVERQATEKYEEMQRDLSKARSELDKSRSQLGEMSDLGRKLKQRLREQDSLNKQLRDDVHVMEKQNHRLKSQEQYMRKTISRLMASLQKTSSKNETLRTTLDVQIRQNEELRRENAQHLKEERSLRTANNRMQSDKDLLEQQMHQAETRIIQYENRMQKLEDLLASERHRAVSSHQEHQDRMEAVQKHFLNRIEEVKRAKTPPDRPPPIPNATSSQMQKMPNRLNLTGREIDLC